MTCCRNSRIDRTLLHPTDRLVSLWGRLGSGALAQFRHPPPPGPPPSTAKLSVPPKPSPLFPPKPSSDGAAKPLLKVSAAAEAPFQSSPPVWLLAALQPGNDS